MQNMVYGILKHDISISPYIPYIDSSVSADLYSIPLPRKTHRINLE